MVIATTTANEPARERPRQAVILAGGRGERMRPLTDDRPKPMIEFHGRPFLAYMIEMLREAGFESVLLLLGYRADVIQDYFGDGSEFGIDIEYSVSAPEDLTVRRVQLARDRIESVFMLLYCDNYWPMRIDHMWSHYRAVGKPGMITVYRNADGYTKDSVKVHPCGNVEIFDRSRTKPGLKGVEISYAILTRAVLDLLPEEDALFEEAVYPRMVEAGHLSAYVTDHRYYSVGSMHRLPLTEEFLARRPVALLDRDGVLNRKPPRAEYVRNWDEFEWLPGAKTALAQLKSAGYRLIVISNQAGVARGAMTAEDLEAVNRRMMAEAAEEGGEIDAIYTCTHGWEEGCECRKPRAGLLFQAQRDFSFDLTRAVFIGDDERDAAAADAAGCGFLRASERTGLHELTENLLGVRGRQLSCAHSN
jgi:D-glycero-D-manno-heptose 1,7-bisphosphate phosphatase